MNNAEKQEYVREFVAVGVFVVALCAVCAFMNGNRLCAFQRCMLKKENPVI